MLLAVCGSCSAQEPPADAQPPADRGAAAQKLHPSLVELLSEFESFVASGGEAKQFHSTRQSLEVAGGTIVLDLVAASSGEDLARDLQRVGAEQIAFRGLNVSCRIPVASIDALPALDSLRYARPSVAQTAR